jgi:hypothetical protein
MGHGRVMEASETICPTRNVCVRDPLGRKKEKSCFSPVALAPALGWVDEGGGKRKVGLRVQDVGLRSVDG